jgi:hypothetical protein
MQCKTKTTMSDRREGYMKRLCGEELKHSHFYTYKITITTTMKNLEFIFK